MRLLRLRVRGFKGLKDVELDLDHDRVLVVGPNEAGKSSILDALITGLYGLAPSKRGSGHAGALKQVLPWTGEPAGVNLTYGLADGRELEVDWNLSGERTRVINCTSGQDISRLVRHRHPWMARRWRRPSQPTGQRLHPGCLRRRGGAGADNR
jgi:DNA repair exonuclease SbcCD ATPase subunit